MINIIHYLIISPIPVLVAKGRWIKALTDHNRRENGKQDGDFNCAIHDFLGKFLCGPLQIAYPLTTVLVHNDK